jgi:hypothetical protein
LVGAKRQAGAEPPGTSQLLLEWVAPFPCPSREDLRASVARLLGGKLDIPAGRTIEVRATVTQGRSWRVELDDGAEARGHRRLIESSSCGGLADATALIVALMIDPNAVAAAPSPGSPGPAPAGDVAAGRKKARTWFGMGILGVAGLGILPGLDAGIGGSLALMRSGWRVDLRASYGLRRDRVVQVSSPAGAYGQFNYTGAVAGVCRNFARARLDLGACADFAVGLLFAEGHNFTTEISAVTPWIGIGPGAYLAIRAGRSISFPLRVALLVPLTRPEFVIQPAEQGVYRVASLSGNLSLGAEVRY